MITYTKHGDYYLPDLILPEDGDNRPIGIWGKRHSKYIREHRKVLFTGLLTSGKLHSYLADINEQAADRFDFLITQLAASEGVTENLKEEDQMCWVGKMNNIRNRAEEIVLHEFIFA